MLEALDLFRIHYGGRPLLLTIAGTILLVAMTRVLPRHHRVNFWEPTAIAAVAIASCAGALAYLSLVVWYNSDPHFFDNAEPTIVSIAWVYLKGAPLYHAADAAERYTHIYGPMAFIAHGLALWAFGPSITVAKWVGGCAGLVSLAFVYGSTRRHCSAIRAAALTGVCALVFLLFRHYTFWTRPDPLQLLCSAAAVYFAGARDKRWVVLLVGTASGILWNLKFTGPLYSLPVFVLLHRRFGTRPAGLALLVAVAVAVFPFLLPNVSLLNYAGWVRSSGQTGLLFSLLRSNLEWAAFLCLPILLARQLVTQESGRTAGTRGMDAALGVAVMLVVVAASKPGAGPYHLIPFVPILVTLVAESLARRPIRVALVPQATVAYVAVLVVLAAAHAAPLVTTMSQRRAVGEVEDLRRFLASHSGWVEMGYGTTEALSLERPELTFRNNAYFIDQPAIREYQLQGLALPHQTIDAVRRCRVDYWLVPKGERPFSGVNSYTAVFQKPLYPAQLQEAFAQTYTLIDKTEYYDVWKCGR